MTLLTNPAFWAGIGIGSVLTIGVAYAINVWVNSVFTPRRGL